MNWQPIETAPADTRIQLGGYRTSSTAPMGVSWWVEVGVAKVTKKTWYGRERVELTYVGGQYTHWRHLPNPPTEADKAEKETPAQS